MILLTTLNARYIHSSLGLRYLHANLGPLQEQSRIIEFTINQRPIDIAETLLETNADIIGFGIYIWNVDQSFEVIALLKSLKPDLTVVLGGPEISYETENNRAFELADYIILGQADLTFAELCQSILKGDNPEQKIIEANTPDPVALELPYQHYTDEDIRQRVIYVEASRGCPFKCEFCLSALDKTSRAFDIEQFLDHMEALYQRGARHYKFVDRTFNLATETSQRILDFFLSKPLDDLFLHFELIPDRLPDSLKQRILRFPPGSLQFEIGIQSFNPEVQRLISRKQDHKKTLDNLVFLRQQTGVHLHTDLIAGLPGENMESFARGFDLLVSLEPHEIQLGILKRLRGTPIIRHSAAFNMVYNPNPPYNILSTRDMNSRTLFRLSRFARYWDMIANSGRFSHSLPVLLGQTPFSNFMSLSDWLFETTQQTHQISLPRLIGLLATFSTGNDFRSALKQDFLRSGIKKRFEQLLPGSESTLEKAGTAGNRQRRHQA